MAKLPFCLVLLAISCNAQSRCTTKMTRQSMLGVPETCELSTYTGCNNQTASGVDTSTDSPTLVICEISHMCILVKEKYMFDIWKAETEEQLENARWKNKEDKFNVLYPDGECRGFDVDGAVVGRPGVHHWMFCLQKACGDELTDAMATGDVFYDCETRTESNTTHVTFANEIRFGALPDSQPKHSSVDFGSTKANRLVPITCTWQTGFFKSNPVVFLPGITTIILIIPGTEQEGRFQVTMKLHKTDSFVSPYTSPPQLSGSANEKLNIELDITGLDNTNAGVRPKLSYLWASLRKDPLDLTEAIFLVWDECEQFDGMVIHMNGDEDLVRVVAPLVGWAKFMDADGNSRSCNWKNDNSWNCQVYLHGYVNICSPYYPNSKCFKKTCSSRQDIDATVKRDFAAAVQGKLDTGRTVDIVDRKRRSVESSLEYGGSGNHLLSLGPFGVSPNTEFFDRQSPYVDAEAIDEERRLDEFVWRMQNELEPEIWESFWIGVILTVCSVVFIIVVLAIIFYYKVWAKRV